MISDYLTDKLDTLTTKLQRHGYRLTDMNVYVLGATLTITVDSCLARDSYAFAAINGAVWSYNLWDRLKWAEKNKDYPESLKVMDRLNIEAIQWRDSSRWISSMIIYVGIVFVLTMIAALIVKPEIWQLYTIFEWLFISLAFLIRCCLFIGPGEFAKHKQEREQDLRNAALDTLP